MMPLEYSKPFVRMQDKLKLVHGSHWKALFEYLKDESNIIESKLPFLLDRDRLKYSSPFSWQKSSSSSNKPGLSPELQRELSKLPSNLRRQVNAALGTKTTRSQSKTPALDVSSFPKSDRFDEFAEMVGKCPLCDELHIYISRTKQQFVSGSLNSCDQFTAMGAEDKAKTVESLGACALCLNWNHNREECNKGLPGCPQTGCDFLHHNTLHGTGVDFVN